MDRLTWEGRTTEGLRLTNELIEHYITFNPNTQIEHTNIPDKLRRDVVNAFWGEYFGFCLQIAEEEGEFRKLLKRQGGTCTVQDQIDRLHCIEQRWEDYLTCLYTTAMTRIADIENLGDSLREVTNPHLILWGGLSPEERAHVRDFAREVYGPRPEPTPGID